MFGCITSIWRKFKDKKELKKIDEEKSNIWTKISAGSDEKGLDKQWAELHHKEMLIKNENYRKMYEYSNELNKKRVVKVKDYAKKKK